MQQLADETPPVMTIQSVSLALKKKTFVRTMVLKVQQYYIEIHTTLYKCMLVIHLFFRMNTYWKSLTEEEDMKIGVQLFATVGE
jgi:hypothetical protein